jgi:hypothetical protein
MNRSVIFGERITMKLSDLPQTVLDDLRQDEQWRLDIDPGFDSKHEFWMAWHHFLKVHEIGEDYEKATAALTQKL